MIGRFAKLGVYQELFKLRVFYIASSAGLLALASFLVDYGHQAPSNLGMSLGYLFSCDQRLDHHLVCYKGAY